MTNRLSHADMRLRLMTIIGLIMLSGVVITSAYEMTLTDSKIFSNEYNADYQGSGINIYSGTFYLNFDAIENWSDIKVVYVLTPAKSSGHFKNLALAKSLDGRPQYVDFILTDTNDNIGNGYLIYNIFYDDNKVPIKVQYWVEFNEWNITGLSGNKKIKMQPHINSPLNQLHIVYSLSTSDVSVDVPITIGDLTHKGMTGHYIANSEFNWVNTITINDTYLSLIRDGYYSKLTVQKGEDTYYEESYDDRNMRIIPPITWTVTNPIGTTFNGSYEGESSPDDPGDPSRVMVHIIAQDARNENLLLDAAVEVRDQYDAVVAAGTTSPEGWMVFEYDLPDTLTDEDFDRYYTVSVSLPGWTQKVTNFKFYPAFIPRSGDWIRVEMLPDTDGPADPEKTYIMFFVRDIHANPLERASIEIAGQYWHTNSAGHVAVEVPKNSTTAYTVRKTGHVSISGSAAVGAEGSYVVNIALGPALPDRTPGPGDDPGATPPPRDTRTNEEKGKAVIDLIADNAELIATLAILAAVMGLINLIMPGRRRR
jgi:hypothetical protein